MPQGHCTYCGDPVDAQTAYRKVSGWVRVREQGGTNTLALRENSDTWACRRCIDSLKRGVDPSTQGSLL